MWIIVIELEIIEKILIINKILELKNNFIYLKYLFGLKIENLLFFLIFNFFIKKYIATMIIKKGTILIFVYSPHIIPIIYPIVATKIGLFIIFITSYKSCFYITLLAPT